MTKSRVGLLAGIASAAFAWWWRQRSMSRSAVRYDNSRGETIYRNTPEPTGLGGGPT
jgi:hypothetical protein